MRKLLTITLLSLFLFTSIQTRAQKAGEVAAVAAGVIGTAIAAAITIEQYQEQLELQATQYLLENRPDFKQFELQLLDFRATKVSDLSNVSSVLFSVKGPDFANQSRMILLMFLSKGWMNDYGVDFTKVRFELFDKNQWGDLFFTYVSLASSVKITDKMDIPVFVKISSEKFNSLSSELVLTTLDSYGDRIYLEKSKYKTDISYATLTTGGIEIKYFTEDKLETTIIPLIRIENVDNSYLVSDFSSKYKVVYNERSMGIYIKELKDLVQLRRSSINAIQNFLN